MLLISASVCASAKVSKKISLPRKSIKVVIENEVFAVPGLLDTGAAVSLIKDTVVSQLGIKSIAPTSITLQAANLTSLSCQGTIDLKVLCDCDRISCSKYKYIRFFVVRGLSEKMIISHKDCLKLKYIRFMCFGPKKGDLCFDSVGTFTTQVNKLDDSDIGLEPSSKEHVCQGYPDELDNVKPEIESKKLSVSTLPESIKKMVQSSKDVFKDSLDKNDFIKIELLPGHADHKGGVKIDVDPSVTPTANRSTRTVPLNYEDHALHMYGDLIDRGVVRRVLPNEKCDWISPSRIIVKPSSTPSNPQLRLVAELLIVPCCANPTLFLI